MNINKQETDKFDQLANDWWNPQGPMKPLHILNPLRLSYIQEYAPLSGKKVIDIGCGAGLLSEAMAKAHANVTAIDAAPDVVAIAKQHANTENLTIDYRESTAEDVASQQAGQFDVVTCLEMLEHVPNPQSVVDACTTLVKPNGFVFFSTINRNIKSFLAAIVGAEYVLRLLPRGTHHYGQLIKPSELDTAARQAGLTLVNCRGVSYNPFTEKCAFTKDVSVNYICCYQKKESHE